MRRQPGSPPRLRACRCSTHPQATVPEEANLPADGMAAFDLIRGLFWGPQPRPHTYYLRGPRRRSYTCMPVFVLAPIGRCVCRTKAPPSYMAADEEETVAYEEIALAYVTRNP